MELNEIENKLRAVRQDSRDLDWQMALYKANLKYRERYIHGLSPNYRQICEWWVEICDDLVEYFKKNTMLEARMKKWYFESSLNDH